MINNVTMGSDIEVLVQTQTDEYFPICGLVGGTKEKPRSLGGGYFIQEDNVLLEFNIPVAKTFKEFSNFVDTGLRKICKELPPSLKIAEQSTASFDRRYIKNNEQALVFGCEPDYDAWSVEQNPRPEAADPYLRSAAGHVHIGWDNPTPEDQLALIRWADIFVTLPSVYESADRQRRQLYGKAGAFRPKPYGVEHRTLDNYWIWSSGYCQAVWNRYQRAINHVNNGTVIDPSDIEPIKSAINSYDVMKARALHKKYDSVGVKSTEAKEKKPEPW